MAALAAVPLLGLLGACDPCTGVVSCRGSHITVEGRILDPQTVAPIANAVVYLVVSDDAGGRDSVAGVSGGDGLFFVRRSGGGPPGKVSLRVTAPGTNGYLIDSVPCALLTINADACILDPIVPVPWVPMHVRATYRGSNRPVVGVSLTFQRTGGTAWTGFRAAETFSSRTDETGTSVPFPFDLYAESLAPIIGTLVAELPAPLGTSVIPDFAIQPTALVFERPVRAIQLGPSLNYALQFLDSASQRPKVGVEVLFERTGGIQVDSTSFRATSNDSGVVAFRGRALEIGELLGTLTVRPAAGAQVTVVPGFSVTTFDNDSIRVAARWQVGATGALYVIPVVAKP